MADHHHQQHQETEAASQGCGMFDFLKKKPDEKILETADTTDAEKACLHPEPSKESNEGDSDKQKPSLAEKLHRSDSSSSDEEEAEGDKKDKKKKGLKEKIKEKVSGHGEIDLDRAVEDKEEKKGIMEKIKEKLPGGHHGKAEHQAHHDDIDKDQKGLIEKIKEKLPGHHKSDDEKRKET